MTQIIIHIGAPRTGTTVLQKHLFPQAKGVHIVSKKAYEASHLVGNKSKPGIAFSNAQDLRQILINADPNKDKLLYFRAMMTALGGISRNKPPKEFEELVEISLSRIANIFHAKPVLISSERLSDNSASLRGDSRHTKTDTQFGVYSLAATATKALKTSCKIVLCLRHPIEYLRSKYIRTTIQRNNQSLRSLRPAEYIQKQSTLEANSPGNSALTPAMHSEYIKRLQDHAFVKAFGFQELLSTDDAFSLMGLQGEGKCAFRDFPRENKLPFTKDQEQAIEIEITQALKQYGFYDRIMKAQMFE